MNTIFTIAVILVALWIAAVCVTVFFRLIAAIIVMVMMIAASIQEYMTHG